VVGTERHESRRVDNQLRGRCGRQGDPGSTRFFLSLEDRIFRVFGGDRIEQMMKAFQVEDLPIESGLLTSALDEAQKKVEQYFYDIRKQLFDYDNVVNSQRERVYAERRGALGLDDMADQMEEYARLTVNDVLEANVDPLAPPEEWALDALAEKMVQYCYLLEGQATGESLGAFRGDYEGLRAFLQEQCVQAYRAKSEEIEAVKTGLTDELQRYIVLSQFDRLWREHLESIKFLQQAVGLRGYAQKDPLTEFKLEAYNIFLEMMAQVRRNCIYAVYQVDAQQLASQMKRQDSENDAAVPAVAAEK
jgi:preprotein translocase subunit SecA